MKISNNDIYNLAIIMVLDARIVEDGTAGAERFAYFLRDCIQPYGQYMSERLLASVRGLVMPQDDNKDVQLFNEATSHIRACFEEEINYDLLDSIVDNPDFFTEQEAGIKRETEHIIEEYNTWKENLKSVG